MIIKYKYNITIVLFLRITTNNCFKVKKKCLKKSIHICNLKYYREGNINRFSISNCINNFKPEFRFVNYMDNKNINRDTQLYLRELHNTIPPNYICLLPLREMEILQLCSIKLSKD